MTEEREREIEIGSPRLARLVMGWDSMWRFRFPFGPWTKGDPPSEFDHLKRYDR